MPRQNTPASKTQLLDALNSAQVAIRLFQSEVGAQSDIYDQSRYTAKHLDELAREAERLG